MGFSYRVRNPNELYFCTFGVVGRKKIFKERTPCEIVMDTLRFYQKHRDLELSSYCLMPDHVHFIARGSRQHPLPEIIRDLKRYTNRRIIEYLKQSDTELHDAWLKHFERVSRWHHKPGNFKVWQDGYHGKELFYPRMMYQKLDYIHNNPVVAGLAKSPEDYYYSSANYYFTREGPLEVVMI